MTGRRSSRMWVMARRQLVTMLTYAVVDSTGLESTCDVTVTINDDESPTLEDCSGLDVVGVTDDGESYGTVGALRAFLWCIRR